MGHAWRAVPIAAAPAAAAAIVAWQVLRPPAALLAVMAIVALAGAAIGLRPLAERHDVARLVALLVPTAATAWATGRLLGSSPVARLAWLLGEEDNAHVVGVARELLAVGPAGAELATQYGTSFATPGVLLLRTGVAGTSTGDPRLDAVTAITASATALPVIVAGAVLMAAAAIGTPRAAGTAQPQRVGQVLGTALAGTVLQLLVVAMPLQLGFLTLAWAVAWVLLGWAGALALLVPGLPRSTRAMLVTQVIVAGLLVEGSWPFLAGAIGLPLLVAVSVAIRRAGRRSVRSGVPAATRVRAAALLLVALLGGGAVLAGSGAVRAVLGLGREAFTAGVDVGSSIVTVGSTLRVAAAVATVVLVLILRDRPSLAAAAVAPTAGALVTLVVVWLLALGVADGITGYGGSKLLLASVLLAVAGLTTVIAAGLLPRSGPILAAIVAVLVLLDPLGRVAAGWWDRTAPAEPAHAVATITALESSSPGLPIRCRPSAGTPATAAAKVAAYFCIVWMEDAFNAERSSGNRFAFFQTMDATFDGVVAEAEADGLYGFAYPLRLGPGWFGWDGTS